MKKKIIIGNWKMNPRSGKDAEKLFSSIAKSISKIRKTAKKTEVIICPPFLYIQNLRKLSKKILLGAQDSFGVDVGAFTGEISPEMLYGIGVRHVILGHSERRALGETNELINRKIKGALVAGLVPVLCVGENERDENHEYFNIVKNQLGKCLNGVSKNSVSKIIIAYEPVWAISTTPNQKDATPKDCEEMVIFIKKTLSDMFGTKIELPSVLYGGSVKPRDAEGFLQDGGVDGLLAGRTSLDAKKFIEIIKICETLNQ